MGSKREPFITAKAIREVIMRSDEFCDWPSSHIQEIWQLASIHISGLGAPCRTTVVHLAA